jgi:uncharacterized membrane protein
VVLLRRPRWGRGARAGAERGSIEIHGHRYIAVLVPSAPVPFGGALIYVPAECVRPADIDCLLLAGNSLSCLMIPLSSPSTEFD